MDTYRFTPIGLIRSGFKEKFGIPRQPGLASRAGAILEILPPYDKLEAFRGLDQVTHLWILFVFHALGRHPWSPTVRPPRLGGNRRMGVFATRSGFRPNPIGISAVRLTNVERRNQKTLLHLRGVDLLDGTPVLDIKPYLPYADAVAEAKTEFAQDPPKPSLEVVFLPEAQTACRRRAEAAGVDLEALIVEILACDPRPAYAGNADANREFGIRLFDFDLRWRVEGARAVVTALAEPSP